MLDAATWLPTLFGAAALVLLCVASGVVIGRRLPVEKERAKPIATITVPPDWSVALQNCQAMSVFVGERMRSLAERMQIDRRSLPPTLMSSIDDLVEAVKQLRKELSEVSAPPKRLPPVDEGTIRECYQSKPSLLRSQLNTTRQLEPLPTLSGDEIKSITSFAADKAETATDDCKRRYKYESWQKIYRCYQQSGIATISPAQSVRCHDIGTKGVSFFCVDSPDYDQLIISLGDGDKPVYLAAEVANSKVVCMHGQVGYLIGCRFTARVPEFDEPTRVKYNTRHAGAKTEAPLMHAGRQTASVVASEGNDAISSKLGLLATAALCKAPSSVPDEGHQVSLLVG